MTQRDGNREIYSISADGSGLQRLTDNVNLDTTPSWSPDGTRIAFSSDRDGNKEVYVMNANGTGVTRLTENGATDFSPSWSPDGERIAFYSARHGNDDIFTMNPDGSEQLRITSSPEQDCIGNAPWSPDGSRIAFFRNTDGQDWEIYVMNADGADGVRLTDNSIHDQHPSWRPAHGGTVVSSATWGRVKKAASSGTAAGEAPRRIDSAPAQ